MDRVVILSNWVPLRRAEASCEPARRLGGGKRVGVRVFIERLGCQVDAAQARVPGSVATVT